MVQTITFKDYLLIRFDSMRYTKGLWNGSRKYKIISLLLQIFFILLIFFATFVVLFMDFGRWLIWRWIKMRRSGLMKK